MTMCRRQKNYIQSGAQNVTPLIVHVTHFLLLQKHLTSGTELILIGWKIFWPFLASFGGQKRPENVAQLSAHIVKLCRVLSEDLCRKVVTNARVRLQEVVRQNDGHIGHVLH